MKQGFFLYPFSAIVGQAKMKRALLINAVDPGIGGLLIKGERGTGKSTAARALADLLPEIDTVAGCTFSCDPHNPEEMCETCRASWEAGQPLPVLTRPMRFVTLPLNASEDRVVGSLDLEKAVREGVKDFEAGILADANRSLLYVDEVNLLDDHIVDILLDAAAMGVNVVEREGVSFSHPSSFIMIGTMNPEEGELRPQLEDRFGLCVEVQGEKASEDRIEVIRRRQRFLADPRLFRASFDAMQETLRGEVLRARRMLPEIELSDAIMELVARIAVELEVCGHRADIATCQAARALAALQGKKDIDDDHIREAAEMALVHRLRRTPFDDQFKGMERLERIIERKGRLIDIPLQDNRPAMNAAAPLAGNVAEESRPAAPPEERCAAVSSREIETPPLQGLETRVNRRANGSRSSAITETGEGRKVGYRLPRPDEEVNSGNLATGPTLRAAAARTAGSDQPWGVRKEDLRASIKRRKVGNLILFILDASASMGCQERIETTKKVVTQLLVDAYQKRDRVGLISFRDEGAQLVLNPTSSVQLANLRIKDLTTGGATPLNHGLAMGLLVARRELRRDPDIGPLLVLITDGHGNVGYASDNPLRESLELAEKIHAQNLPCLVFDTSPGASRNKAGRTVPSHARRIADAMGAEYHHLAGLQPEDMLDHLNRHL
ncbi:MAG: VWA domain-containing protein [Actinomycetota bacterium]